jgi:hypothetical protein
VPPDLTRRNASSCHAVQFVLRMLLRTAGWSVLDDVTNTTSVTFVTLLYVLPVCAAASVGSIATCEAGRVLQARLYVPIGGQGAAACCRLLRRRSSVNCCVTAAWRKDVHSDSTRVQCRLVTPRAWVGLRNVGSRSSTD